jgi:uncharacterized protein (DUF362 family)/NAD-dependent dihydropyrimidine dehydrogenase PreA subunit
VQVDNETKSEGLEAVREEGRQAADRGASAVAAACCTDYDPDAVRSAVREVLAPLGGMQAFVRPGERIALKPNLLMAATPERAIATHPAVLTAVALEVRGAGGVPVVVEGPGSGVLHVAPVIERTFRGAGYRDAADKYGFELSLDTSWETVENPEGERVKRLEIMSPILRVDGVINIPKLKTHMYMKLSGATKNLFGLIPGLNKAAYHGKLPDPGRFADMLLDVAYFVRPRLHVVDGITAMEGDGPGTGGRPRQLGVLVAGADAVAVDAACCRIIGMETGSVPILVAAKRRGLWSGRETDVETLGTSIEELAVADFAMPGVYTGMGLGSGGMLDAPLKWLLERFNRMPRPKTGRCTLCGACERACPRKAISLDIRAKVAKVDDSLCIRCYCCHEMCPSAAIDLEYTGIARLVRRTGLLK